LQFIKIFTIHLFLTDCKNNFDGTGHICTIHENNLSYQIHFLSSGTVTSVNYTKITVDHYTYFYPIFYGGYVGFELSTKNSTEIDIYYDNRTIFRKERIEGNLVLNSDLTLVDKYFHLDINLIQSQNLFWILQVFKNNNSWNIGYYSLNTIDLNGKV